MAAAASIRFATRADALAIAEMSRDLVEQGLGWSWTKERVLRSLRHPDTNAIVALPHGCEAGHVGFAIMKYGDEAAHLLLLAVRPAEARRGIGTAMLRWLEESARVAGIARITLEARAGNAAAGSFYRRLGYSTSQLLPGYYGGRETSVRMIKTLHLESTDAS